MRSPPSTTPTHRHRQPGLETSGTRITGINLFRDTRRLFPLFALPDRLDPA
ncbi:hypothetical protein [Embleya sp. NPDC001921]